MGLAVVTGTHLIANADKVQIDAVHVIPGDRIDYQVHHKGSESGALNIKRPICRIDRIIKVGEKIPVP